MLRVALLVVVVFGVFSGVPVDLAEAQPSDPAQEEFVPMEGVPPRKTSCPRRRCW